MITPELQFKLADQFLFHPYNNSLEELSNSHSEHLIGNNESQLLLLFCQSPNQVFSRSEIQKFVWEDHGVQVDDSSLTQAIFNLRKLLGDSSKTPKYVMTIPKSGYKFIASVEKVSLEALQEQVPYDAVALDDTRDQREARDTKRPAAIKISNQHCLALVFTSILLPVSVYFYSANSAPDYFAIKQIQGIPVKTWKGKPVAKRWNDALTHCIPWFISHYSIGQLPAEIIVTGGIENKLQLNYVYEYGQSMQNLTLSLISSEEEPYHLCESKDRRP